MRAVINYYENKPDWDGASLVKLCCDTTVPVDERIFCLGQVVLTKDKFSCRIWSFEVKTGDDIKLRWKMGNDNNEDFEAEVSKDGKFSLFVKGEDMSTFLTTYLISGEDLQGEYWGAVMSVPLSVVLKFLGKDAFSPKDKLTVTLERIGNFVSGIKEQFEIIY